MTKRIWIVLISLVLVSLACNLPFAGGPAPVEEPGAAQPVQPATQPEADPEAPAGQPPNQPPAVEAPPPTAAPEQIDPQPVGMRQGLASLNTFKLVMVTKTSGPTNQDQSETRVEMTGDNPNEAIMVYNRSSSSSAEYPEPDISESYQYTVGLESCEGFGEEWEYESSTPAEQELRDAMSGLFDMLVLGPGAEYVGVENVNGIESRHFSFRLAGIGAESGAVVNANQGDYWLAVDGRYLVRYMQLVEISPTPEEVSRLEVEVDLSDINQPVSIALPAGCQAASSTP